MLDENLKRCSGGRFDVGIELLCGLVDCSGNILFEVPGVPGDRNNDLG